MNIMWYRVGKIIRYSNLILIIYTIIWVGCGILFENRNYMMIDEMIMIAPITAEVYPLKEMQEYQTFGFSRKKLFGFCILGEGIRAFLYGGIFRTTFQVLFYSEYVKIYSEYVKICTEDAPKEIASQYHQCPVWELFLVNMVLFFLLRLILVFDSTRKYPAFDFANALNKKKKAIMSRKRKWIRRIVEVPVLFIVAMSFFMFALGSYDFMLRNPIREKIVIYSIVLVGSVVFLVILWWRFRSGKKMET
ncbi:MAG: hypothetical protein HDT30_13295 [Clostridiales bacterium]|nr:hypothetical protein [Clostridiales bacterium]